MEFLLVLAIIAIIYFWHQSEQHNKTIESDAKQITDLQSQISSLNTQLEQLNKKLIELTPFQHIVDIQAKATEILTAASSALQKAKIDADTLRQASIRAAREKTMEANGLINKANEQAATIIENAKKNAEEIAGDALEAKGRAAEFNAAAKAMKNIIEGYGDEYIIPTYSLLDSLADEYGHTETGDMLKKARDISKNMVKTSKAAACDYAESNRKETAIRFVIDAFNGKTDSILSRSKSDNYGKLEQEIKDAYSIVNINGVAFRNARITEEYLTARINELKWAVAAHALKEQERDEQRLLREQIREEEKARKEYERAIKDAAKEEETLKKAMEKVQHQVAAATEANRAEFEAKLHELEAKLAAAEEKNQRALSMAQQTRTGHVYVISNIGSFGEDVFKIGMTRRLEPTDRVRELGDASVPFEFDIHAMIFSEDAPSLEKNLHRQFLKMQINKVNPRKEFFRLGLGDIRSTIESMGLATHWTMASKAYDYRETLRIEQQIKENPQIAREWTKKQMDFESIGDIEQNAVDA